MDPKMSATCTTKTISSEAPTIIDEEEIQPNDVLFYGSSPKVAHRKHVGTIAFRADLHRFVDEFQRCPANVIAQGIVQHVQKEYGKGSRFLKRVEFADVVQYRLVGWRNTWFVLDATSAMAKIEKMVMRIKPQTWETTNLNGEEATYHSKSDKPDAMFDNGKNDSIMLPGGGSSNGTDAVTNCADENTCKDSPSNDNGSGILYVSFVGGHSSNPILRIQLPSEGEEPCGNTSKFHLPYSGPNEALEASELLEISLKQANIIDINPLPPRSSSANTNAHTSTIDNSVDDSRAQRHRARKDMIKSIYCLLKNQPDTWPQQWKAWFADLPRPQLSSFVAKIENMMYKRSKSFDAHIDMDTLPKRLYLVLTELDNKRRTLASADVGRNESDTHEEVINKAPNDANDGRLTPSPSLPEASSTHDLAIPTAGKPIINYQAKAMQVDCSLDDKNTCGSDGISPQSVMEDLSQGQQQQLVYHPHPQQAFFPQAHNLRICTHVQAASYFPGELYGWSAESNGPIDANMDRVYESYARDKTRRETLRN